MDYKFHVKNAIIGAIIGGFMGFVMSYITAKGQEIPSSIQQYSMSQGIAGLISGVMGGLLAIIVPYIIIPFVLKRKHSKK